MKIYSSELGAELPADVSKLDPEVWWPIYEDIELLICSDEKEPPDSPAGA